VKYLSTLVQEEPGYGADVLRLWVSSVDYTGDVLIGQEILRQMSDMYRKLRGTMRFLVSNLHDWEVSSVGRAYVLVLFLIRGISQRATNFVTYFNLVIQTHINHVKLLQAIYFILLSPLQNFQLIFVKGM
jgi:isoleucyl-tRNA synthetase